MRIFINAYHIPAVIIVLLAMLFIRPVVMAGTEDEVATDLDDAVGRIVAKLNADSPYFSSKNASVCVRARVDQSSNPPLATIIEQATRRQLLHGQLFSQVSMASDLQIPSNNWETETLRFLESKGFDRVLDLSAHIKGRRFVLHARAIWLHGGSWWPLQSEPKPYMERMTRIRVADSSEWALLSKPTEALSNIRLAWSRREIGTTSGRVLDIAAGDVNKDGRPDLGVLLENRVEIWLAEGDGFKFRFVKPLTNLPTAQYGTRYPAGEIEICNPAFNLPGQIAVRTNRHAEGAWLVWDEGKLQETGQFEGVPLGCTAEGLDTATYEEGTHLLAPKIKMANGDTINFKQSFLSALKTPDGLWFTVRQDGKVTTNTTTSDYTFRCGLHPAWVTSGSDSLLICSEPSIMPRSDSLISHNVANPNSETDNSGTSPGSVLAIASISEDSFEVVAARYHEKDNTTVLELYAR